MPAWNVAPWIGCAISSVLAQSHRDWTMVVVDDGSTDATNEIVAGIRDARIRLIRQANAGVSAARNRGIAELDAEALLFLDADDWLAPDALSRLACALRLASQAVAATAAYTFVSTNTTSARTRRPPSGDILARLLVRNCFANGGHLLIRRAAVNSNGGFLRDITFGEDWEYWTRIALQGSFVAVPGKAPLLYVRQRAGGAYHRLATDPAAFAPCMQAIFANPALQARFSPTRLAAIRCRTEAENAWIIGRELIRHGKAAEGRSWLLHSVRANPAPKRIALLAAAHALPLLPPRLHGPFQPYQLRDRVASRGCPPVADC